jgi:hypothetical protein
MLSLHQVYKASMGIQHKVIGPDENNGRKWPLTFEHLKKPVMIHVVEEASYVSFNNRVIGTKLELPGQLCDGIVGATPFSIPVTAIQKVLLIDCCQHLRCGRLDQPIL